MSESDDTKACPYCGEQIKQTAVKCKHCGEFLDDSGKTKKKKEKGILKYILIFFVCIVIICTLFSSDEPKCESSQVKDMVIEIFKQNNPFCINNSDSITSITLENPIADSYDSSINKYSCKGTVIVKSNNRNSDYTCDVEYTAQKTGSNLHVETDYCSSPIFEKALRDTIFPGLSRAGY